MQALLHEALLPVNIAFTVLLVFVLLYWLTVLLGLIDFNFADLDLDVSAETDAELDTVAGEGGNWLHAGLQFFNFGHVPFMVAFSFLTICMWAFSILINYYVGHGSWATAAILFLPNLAASLLATKLITAPLIPIFRHLDGSETPVDYIGQECTLTLPASGSTMGQAEVLINNSPLLVNVKTVSEQQLEKGIKALIVNEDPAGKYYLIKKMEE